MPTKAPVTPLADRVLQAEPPAPEPGWITIGAKNNAVPPGHWFYLFHIVPDQPDKPFCFEESVGGGHTAGGGAIQLSLFELDGWPGEWRKHVAKAGCPWVAEIIDSRLNDDVQSLITAIRARRNS
ncbi:hypothetical protein YA0783_24985 [Pseudomonas corrugata]|uniref:hypothetical protein n=1 Tax=Pseudomonas corrugata TaxID=47879 RepID=UPI0018E647B7|nr:hypothetical protein [Pseudomonas corrugata]MBI6621547.1 hypothetical protein [Pseudomonas corrugata]MBI6694218.1 hypothetical protein [Pseudomonas corrugata]